MSAVSKSVMPASSAASTTARVASRSIRPPKLLQPSPTTETSGPSRPNRRVRMRVDASDLLVRYRELGWSDLEVSELALGSWLTYGGGVARDRAEACVAKAFEVGINFVDTANVYARGGAEEFLGEVLAGPTAAGGHAGGVGGDGLGDGPLPRRRRARGGAAAAADRGRPRDHDGA